MAHGLVAECRYGWGQLLRLYQDALDVGGAVYQLSKVERIESRQHRRFGIASTRLDLYVDGSHLVLRGIVERSAAERIVRYVTSWCAMRTPIVDEEDVCLAECASQLPVLPTPVPFDSGFYWEYSPGGDAQSPAVPMTLSGGNWHYCDPALEEELRRQRRYRLKRLQSERSLREHGFDVEALARRLCESPLPHLQVPPRLQAGEVAHYSTEAVLCDDVTAGKPALRDQGILILTNKRIIFLGHKRQLVLRYEQLFNFAQLQGTFEIFAAHWNRRQLFEMPRPLECYMYLEQILRHMQQSTTSMISITLPVKSAPAPDKESGTGQGIPCSVLQHD